MDLSDKFLYEQIASGHNNLLQISSTCSARCLFCSNNQNPFEIERLGFRSLESIERGISLLSPGSSRIELSDSIPGRISEGEALLHPDFFKILLMVRSKFYNPISLRTNGSTLTPDKINSLAKFKPLIIDISFCSHNPENWAKVTGLSEKYFNIAANSFKGLLESGIEVRSSIVPLANLFGYDDIEKTILWMANFSKEIFIWPPGYTKSSTEEVRSAMDISYSEISDQLKNIRRKSRSNLLFLADPYLPLNFYPYNIILASSSKAFKRVLWFFSEGTFDRASSMLKEFDSYSNNEHIPFRVKNETYGGNIICSGLLMVNDFRIAMKEALRKCGGFDLAIIPKKRSIDYFGLDLTGENYNKLSEEFSFKIWDA